MSKKLLQSANVTRGEDKTKPKRGLQKDNRGGKRQGSGAKRKEVHKHSIVMRVPGALHETVKAMVQQYNESNAVIGPNIPTKPIVKRIRTNTVEDITIVIYECGCKNDNGIFRRLRPCTQPMATHTAKE